VNATLSFTVLQRNKTAAPLVYQHVRSKHGFMGLYNTGKKKALPSRYLSLHTQELTITVFWDVKLCMYQRFRGTCYLHPQGIMNFLFPSSGYYSDLMYQSFSVFCRLHLQAVLLIWRHVSRKLLQLSIKLYGASFVPP
jgi:hypothetical protein